MIFGISFLRYEFMMVVFVGVLGFFFLFKASNENIQKGGNVNLMRAGE